MRLSGTACDGTDRSIMCAQFHSCEYGYIRSVHVNNAVSIALSHYSYFCLLIGGGQSTWLLSTVDCPPGCGQSSGQSSGRFCCVGSVVNVISLLSKSLS